MLRKLRDSVTNVHDLAVSYIFTIQYAIIFKTVYGTFIICALEKYLRNLICYYSLLLFAYFMKYFPFHAIFVEIN